MMTGGEKPEVNRKVKEEWGAEMAEEEEKNDPVTVASQKPLEMDEKIGELEKIHGMVFLEKSLGLLASILPQDTNVRR